jgi:hypothetical protein
MQTNSTATIANDDRPTPTDVRVIRERNRAERVQVSVVDNVLERLEVYATLAANHEMHPRVKREHAERIVEAVLGLTNGGVQ